MFRSFLKVVREVYSEKFLWTLMVAAPVVASVMIIAMLRAETPLHLPVGIVLGERSNLATQIVRAIEASPVTDVQEFCADVPECASKMRMGEISAIVVLEAGLERKARRHEAPAVPVYTNAQVLLISNLVQKDLRASIGTCGAKLNLKFLKDPLSSEIHSIGNPTANFEAYLGFGLVSAIFHLAAMVTGVYLITWPLRAGKTKELLLLLGGSRPLFLAATCLPAAVMLPLESCAFHLIVRSTISPVSALEFRVVLLAHFLTMFAALMFGLCAFGIFGNMRMASSSAGVIGGPAFAFSGQTFPIFAMPAFGQILSGLLPLTHLISIESSMLLGDFAIVAVYKPLGTLGLLALVFCAIGCTLTWLRLGRLDA